jgi:hypothetical protein
VFDPHALGPSAQRRLGLAGEAAGLGPAQKPQHILRAKVQHRVLQETRIEGRQRGGVPKQHVGRIFPLP